MTKKQQNKITPKISAADLKKLAITQSEYNQIVELLGRTPSPLELGIFGSLWSEHCGYKHSKPLLKIFKNNHPRVLTNESEENAGAVDIGNNLAIVMKIESHNHPSAIEPTEGAATAIGGIIRDIFSMGARPIALLNSLRFGNPDNPKNRYLMNGVISGISNYGNCIGIPNIGGELFFSKTYDKNPIVNAMCVGIVTKQHMTKSTAGTPGNLIILAGSTTGRDGIHGASGLASQNMDGDDTLRPAVQVGNPFMEKKLIESCLEAIQSGKIIGMQDLGAAGLTSATVDLVSKDNIGFKIDLSRVFLREENMTPYEIMLSESQERMIMVINPTDLIEITRIFEKWDVDISVIGETIPQPNAVIYDKKEKLLDLPINTLTSTPTYQFPTRKPKWLTKNQEYKLKNIPVNSKSPAKILLSLLASPNISSKKHVYQQYDHQVLTNTVIGPGSDAAILRIKNTKTGLAFSTDGNSKYCYLNPFHGGAIAVAEACRNLSTIGATPIAITDCLNFGNPEDPDIYYQLKKCISGISTASNKLNVPVISGNVSLYNANEEDNIFPTPIIGALGILDNINNRVTNGFKDNNSIVILIGDSKISQISSSLSGSEYLDKFYGKIMGNPQINLVKELAVQTVCRSAIQRGIIESAHDCSDGGLLVCLAESCIIGNTGFRNTIQIPKRWDFGLFGEQQSRIVVSINKKDITEFEKICNEFQVNWCTIGTTGGDSLTISSLMDIPVSQLAEAWETHP